MTDYDAEPAKDAPSPTPPSCVHDFIFISSHCKATSLNRHMVDGEMITKMRFERQDIMRCARCLHDSVVRYSEDAPEKKPPFWFEGGINGR